MSQNQDEYGFLNNIDQKVLYVMAIVTILLVGGAIWLNLAVRKDVHCTSSKYVYCGHTPDPANPAAATPH